MVPGHFTEALLSSPVREDAGCLEPIPLMLEERNERLPRHGPRA